MLCVLHEGGIWQVQQALAIILCMCKHMQIEDVLSVHACMPLLARLLVQGDDEAGR
jgi:hypothetical protein